MSPDELGRLREMLRELRDLHGSCGLKVSTEDRGNSWPFIDFVQKNFGGLLPLSVKIGGPEAKNDMKAFRRTGAAGVIAPMIESPFGVNKFVSALEGFVGRDEMGSISVSVNIESVYAYRRMDDILMAPGMEQIDQIVVGATDLARSVSRPVHDPDVQRMVMEMTKKSREAGKHVRIGGVMKMAPDREETLRKLLQRAEPDQINTGNVCFSVGDIPDLNEAHTKASRFEREIGRINDHFEGELERPGQGSNS